MSHSFLFCFSVDVLFVQGPGVVSSYNFAFVTKYLFVQRIETFALYYILLVFMHLNVFRIFFHFLWKHNTAVRSKADQVFKRDLNSTARSNRKYELFFNSVTKAVFLIVLRRKVFKDAFPSKIYIRFYRKIISTPQRTAAVKNSLISILLVQNF